MSATPAHKNPWPQRLLSIALLLIFIVLVQRYFGWGTILAPWRAVSWGMIALATLLAFASYLLRAWRLYDYFHREMAGGFLLCSKLMLQHNLLNNLLPMRSGELSFPLLMARYFQLGPARSLPVLLWFRVLDLHALLLLGLFSLGSLWWTWAVTLLVTLAWFTLPFALYHYGHHHVHDAHRADDTVAGVRRVWRKVLAGLPPHWSGFARAYLITLINWLVKLGAFAFVLLLFVPLSPTLAWLGVTGGDLTSVLPIHGVAGAGTYEAGVVAVLLPLGVNAEMALTGAVNVHLFLLASTLIGGAVSLLMKGARRG